MPPTVDHNELVKAAEAFKKYKTVTATAKALGIPRSTLDNRLRLANIQAKNSEKPTEPKYEQVFSENSMMLDSVSERIKTLDDALKHGNVDLDVWMVEKFTVNSWEVAMKLVKNNDRVITKSLWQVKVWLKRIMTKALSETLERFVQKMKKHAPKYNLTLPKKNLRRPHALEVALFDVHFGKLSLKEETGDDCNLENTQSVFLKAVDDLLAQCSHYSLEEIVFPVGNDFLHINNAQNTTCHGTPQSTDRTMYKIFEIGMASLIQAIDKCILFAPVKMLWIPGNHDYDTSWFLAKCLQAHYNRCKNVQIDTTPTNRKYYKYGNSMIGFTHGDEESHRDLPLLMATEEPEKWASTITRHWHIGHTHKRKETVHNAADTYNGVEVRVIPSLSGTDPWHYRNGYTKNKSGRAAEAYLWCKENGYVAHYNSYVK